MPNLLAHGFQTMIHTAPGAGLFPFMVEESLIGFLEQSSRFLEPAFADDTNYPALELVLEGLQKFLIRRRTSQS